MLLLFYSLAIDMYCSLGKWPPIGENGFLPWLVAHSALAVNFFIALVWFGVLVLPTAILVCLLDSRWRPLIAYFALAGLLLAVSWGLMLLAPEPYLRWWRD